MYSSITSDVCSDYFGNLVSIEGYQNAYSRIFFLIQFYIPYENIQTVGLCELANVIVN